MFVACEQLSNCVDEIMSACVDAFDVLLEREVCVEKYAEKLDLCLSLDVFVLYVD